MDKKFPKQIPVFPLSGVIYFPKTNLPLNIFEDRYLELVNDSFRNDKLMGMVQSKKENSLVYKVGCLGKISDYQETSDGRVIINLTGLTRFEITREISNQKKYREFEVDYKKFYKDVLDNEKLALAYDKLNFMEKIKKFFERNGLMINWKEFEKLDEAQKINTLSMIAPISNEEKQKLLETVSLNDKTNTLLNIIEFYSYEKSSNRETIQ
ncbi:LON peptidase substrate-binding domain-containing protein [Pelagibacteraceae bacterium]|nr:LON peptidase substrate-binding domain-containing protein [Pelagibacteraceae bacterium]